MATQGDIQIASVLTHWRRFATAGPSQIGGRVPAAWIPILARNAKMPDVVMVIDLVFGGRGRTFSIRIATQPVSSLDSRTGTRHDVEPLLIAEPPLAHDYEVGSGTSNARALTFTLDGRVIDAPTIIRDTGILAGYAEVSLEPADRESDYLTRYVLLRGDMTGVRFGVGVDENGRGELLEVEVVDPKETIGTKLPPWVVTTERFSGPHITALGERYPIVRNGYRTIPCVRVTDNGTGAQDFVIAQGRAPTNGYTATVYVNGVSKASGDATYGWTFLTAEEDLLGEPYIAIRFTNGATTWEDSDAVHVTLDLTDGEADEETVVQILRGVLESFSPLSLVGSNAELYATAEGRMPVGFGAKLLTNASGGKDASNALQWAEDGFLSSFPMLSMVWENGAYGPVLTDARLPPMANWIVGAGPILDRDTLFEETPKAELFNEYVLRYDYDPMLDVFRKVIVRGAANSAVCEYSRELIDERHAEPLEAVHIVDDDLAEYVLNWLVFHFALPSYTVEYVAFPSVLLTHRRGDPIRLTDAEMGWTSERATIDGIRYERGRAVVRLKVWVRHFDFDGAAFSARVGAR